MRRLTTLAHRAVLATTIIATIALFPWSALFVPAFVRLLVPGGGWPVWWLASSAIRRFDIRRDGATIIAEAYTVTTAGALPATAAEHMETAERNAFLNPAWT